MKEKVTRWKKALFTGVACLGILGNVHADSIARGQRGPTEWQADLRLSLGERENTAGVATRSLVNQNIVKYWNGGSKGIWGFGAFPYKILDNGTSENSGLGDITLGGGPRFAFTNYVGSFHFLPYVALTLPIGDSTSKPALGNNRIDFKVGTGFTYLPSSKKGEISGIVEYTRTGIDKELKIPDEVYGGILAGGSLSVLRMPRLRMLTGITGTTKIGSINDGDYVITSRTALRCTPPNTKRWHTELWVDHDIKTKGMPKGHAVTGMLRLNF